MILFFLACNQNFGYGIYTIKDIESTSTWETYWTLTEDNTFPEAIVWIVDYQAIDINSFYNSEFSVYKAYFDHTLWTKTVEWYPSLGIASFNGTTLDWSASFENGLSYSLVTNWDE